MTDEQMKDIRLEDGKEHDVEVRLKADGSVLWVNVDGICALRICNIPLCSIRLVDDSLEMEEPEG